MVIGITDSFQKIVRSGLVLDLDAGFSRSYPGSGAIWYDLSGNGNNINFINAYGTANPTYSNSYGGYLDLYNAGGDQVRYGQITVPASLKPTSITIEAWVYMGTTVSPSNETIISLQKGTGEAYSYWVRYLDGRIGAEIAASGGTSAYPAGGNPTISANTWYHVMVTYDKTTLRIYIQGTERATSTATSGDLTYDSLNTKMLIGARYAGAGYDTNATQWWGAGRPDRGIATIRMYNRALTAAEVLQNFNILRLRFNV